MDPSQSSSSSLPPVQLPVVQDESQASALPPKSPIVDMDEKDLFGSSSEEEGAAKAPAAAGTSAGSAPVGQSAAERDLFGDDAEDDMNEQDLFGTDDEAMDEKDLFGSDDDAAPGDSAAAHAGVGQPQPPSRAVSEAPTAEPSEMDEEDIFGRDLSDDEVADDKKELEEVVLRRRPMPSGDRNFAALRIPNILTVEKKPFNPLKFSEDVRNGFKEIKNTQAKQTFQLMNPENVIRWRFKKSEEGQILTSDDGRPQYESNSRVVEWEDGSRTLYVGSEAFPISSMDDNVVLFEENTQETSVCHGFIKTRLVATPRSLESVTHEHVKKAQFNKFEPNSRSLLINTDDQAFLQQQQALEKERQKEKEKRDKKMLKVGAEESKMNAAFLESDDDSATGPSVKKPKHF